ncbi:MAG: hypothetical protein AAF268_05915 [Cyanobacteria bacterium P01_A01_bin.3]
MTTVFRPSSCTHIANTRHVNAPYFSNHSPHATLCSRTSARPQDSLRKPATILVGAAALILSLVPTGTFKLSEAAPLAAIATGGAIACLTADKHGSDKPNAER